MSAILDPPYWISKILQITKDNFEINLKAQEKYNKTRNVKNLE